MKQRVVYDREFKANALKLSYERSNLSLFAREPGVITKKHYNWRSQHKQRGSESFPGKGNTAVEAKVLAKLKKESACLQQEHEILKKLSDHLQK
ncbi:transposase [Dysgonomonas sp. Marseille-P4361]|uniref:transposase n=1 Tax=Dysgonomonas sp. Marseille-P4361 TaxID=2161820 RepID=UPI000D55064B|nr:transposase [Dysgonomonas sp. Marseille-P4361]